MNKRYIRKVRKAKLQELKHVLSEASSFSVLQENKNLPSTKKKAKYLISEYNRLVGAYSALLMLEFYEKGTLETIGVLKNIMSKNALNGIGLFLNTVVHDLHDTVDAMDKVGVAEKDLATDQKPIGAGGVYSGTRSSMPQVGFRSGFGLEEEINEGFFDFLKKNKKEPYMPKPSSVIDPRTGEVIGFSQKPQRTSLGYASELTKERDVLLDKYTKQMAKVVPFIVAYLAVFTEENREKLKSTKKGFFGSSPAASLIKREFGKVPGFDVEKFITQIEKRPDIIDKNIQLATDPNRFEALTTLEDIFQKVKTRTKKGLGATLSDFLGGASHYPSSRPARA